MRLRWFNIITLTVGGTMFTEVMFYDTNVHHDIYVKGVRLLVLSLFLFLTLFFFFFVLMFLVVFVFLVSRARLNNKEQKCSYVSGNNHTALLQHGEAAVAPPAGDTSSSAVPAMLI